MPKTFDISIEHGAPGTGGSVQAEAFPRFKAFGYSYQLQSSETDQSCESARVGNRSVTIMREWGEATPQILQSARMGVALDVSMHFGRKERDGNDVVYRVVRLTDARITNIRQFRGPIPWCPPDEVHEVEELTFEFSEMETVDTDRTFSTLPSPDAFHIRGSETPDIRALETFGVGRNSQQQATMVTFLDLRDSTAAVRSDIRPVAELFSQNALLASDATEDLFAYAVLGPRCVHTPGRATLGINVASMHFVLDPDGERIFLNAMGSSPHASFSITVVEDGIYIVHFNFAFLTTAEGAQISVVLPGNVSQSVARPPNDTPFALAVAVVLKAGQSLTMYFDGLVFLVCTKIRLERATV